MNDQEDVLHCVLHLSISDARSSHVTKYEGGVLLVNLGQRLGQRGQAFWALAAIGRFFERECRLRHY
jgi:hypothetical protein